MTNNAQEFLVTGQAYEKNDPYKQTILLHDTFFANSEDEAKALFDNHFRQIYKVMQIYSVIDITSNNV